MKTFFEELQVDGHLQIVKISSTGEEEILFDDHNIIVSGMGLGLAHLFSLSGPGNILEYQIDRFQVGVGGSPALEDVSTNKLGDQLTSLSEYGENALLYVIEANQAYNTVDPSESAWFGYIPQHKVSRVGENMVRYTITLDKDAANNLSRNGSEVSLNEIGLFMKNPMGNLTGQNIDTSILVAYRHFTAIRKSEDFALVFKWTINW